MRVNNPLKLNNLRQEEIYWIAGFFEGEGTFNRCGGSITISASQVNKEPVEKLHNLLGGHLIIIKPKKITCKDYFRWGIYGETAEIVMKMIFPIMSDKIKNRISEVLSWYASRPGRNFAKSGRKTCRKELHQWTDENTFINYRGQRACRLCNNLAQARYRLKKQLNLN